MTDARLQFLKEQFTADPEVSQFKLNPELKSRFGKGLAPVNIKKLRDAFKAGNLEATYNALFPTAPAQPAAAPVAAAPAPVSTAGVRAPKSRGDRRDKEDLRGRRLADRSKVLLEEFHPHLVVFRVEGVLQQENFSSRDRAEDFVRDLLDRGHKATEIGYYKLNPMKARITVEL